MARVPYMISIEFDPSSGKNELWTLNTATVQYFYSGRLLFNVFCHIRRPQLALQQMDPLRSRASMKSLWVSTKTPPLNVPGTSTKRAPLTSARTWPRGCGVTVTGGSWGCQRTWRAWRGCNAEGFWVMASYLRWFEILVRFGGLKFEEAYNLSLDLHTTVNSTQIMKKYT